MTKDLVKHKHEFLKAEIGSLKMFKADPSVDHLSTEELREVFFQNSFDSGILSNEQLVQYQKLSDLLANFPIRNRKVCLLVPPTLDPQKTEPRAVENKRYSVYPPYGLMMLSSALRHLLPDWSVEIIDLSLEALKRTARHQPHDVNALLELIPDDCDLYGFSILFEPSQTEALHFLRHLSGRGKLLIAGGPQSSANFENLLKFGHCDIVIKKEGQAQFVKLLNFWEKVNCGSSEAEAAVPVLSNLSFKHNGDIVSFDDRRERTVCPDIRKEYSLIDLDGYNDVGMPNLWARSGSSPDRRWATLLTNRGCRGRCAFCQVNNLMGNGVRSRSVDDVMDELSFLYHEKKVRHVEIIDDDLLAYHDRALELFDRWASLDLDLTFSTGNALLAISIDEKVAKAMSQAGCVVAGFGVETANEKRLKTLCKPIVLSKVEEACQIFKKNHPHIWLFANFMIGFPNETYAELFNTFDYAKDLRVDFCQCAVLFPIPGTAMFEQLRSLGDERVVHGDETAKINIYTPGQWAMERGLTFDDRYKEVYDFRKMDPDKNPGPLEIQQFQIYFNVFVNLIGNPNLQPSGEPKKILNITDHILRFYLMDAVAWGVNAKAARLLGNEERYEFAAAHYKKAVKESPFWSKFFEIYDVAKMIGIPV
ncbi:MAG TPA: radical SAM protein [Candidatus Omnitrophota bacterium]|nr:radical SAM protein [Candidatus Omnitrophota bacterium]HPD85579.1 radical SAM protein [Candidatus Omnitrophota bacterium]HRZ04381.1 radical SAM protein [Candidatus Omnitrophota bacterium]